MSASERPLIDILNHCLTIMEQAGALVVVDRKAALACMYQLLQGMRDGARKELGLT